MQPQLVIDVNEQTGIWTTDGLPMLYVPRHFFVNNHIAVEAALGRESYAEILYSRLSFGLLLVSTGSQIVWVAWVRCVRTLSATPVAARLGTVLP